MSKNYVNHQSISICIAIHVQSTHHLVRLSVLKVVQLLCRLHLLLSNFGNHLHFLMHWHLIVVIAFINEVLHPFVWIRLFCEILLLLLHELNVYGVIHHLVLLNLMLILVVEHLLVLSIQLWWSVFTPLLHLLQPNHLFIKRHAIARAIERCRI